MDKLKNQITKLRGFAATRPKLALPLFASVGLLALLLISFLVAIFIQDDSEKTVSTGVAQIQITKDGFLPATIAVDKGTKIIWTNSDKTTHQIQANPHPTGDSLPGLRSEILNSEQTYEYIADSPGTYGYHDHISPTTNGTIEVRE